MPGVPPTVTCGLLLVGGFVIASWPRPAGSPPLEQYRLLEQAPIPVLVIGWLQPRSARAELVPGGYVVTIDGGSLGTVTVAGNQDADALPGGMSQTWQDGGATYGLASSAIVSEAAARVVPLTLAEQQLTGNRVDTPILYVWYLPLFGLFFVWVVGTSLFQPPET